MLKTTEDNGVDDIFTGDEEDNTGLSNKTRAPFVGVVDGA
jgi:hypothetical protein